MVCKCEELNEALSKALALLKLYEEYKECSDLYIEELIAKIKLLSPAEPAYEDSEV